MHRENASAVVIIPKQPFIKWANWANFISGFGRELSAEFFTDDCSILIIPQFLTEKEAREYVSTVWPNLFEQQLERYVEKALWPQNRTIEIFLKWFGFQFHSTVSTCLLADQ